MNSPKPQFSDGFQPPVADSADGLSAVPDNLHGGLVKAESLAPGAVRVPHLEDAAVILDPNVHFVLVSRPAWIAGPGAFIREHIGAFLQEASCSSEASLHQNVEMRTHADVPGWLQRSLHVSSRRDALALLNADFESIRQWFRDLTEATTPYSCMRIEFRDNSPGTHVDAQALTCGCCYAGGGTRVYLSDGRSLHLQPGEIGLWKGSVREDDSGSVSYNLLDASAWVVNEGQAVLHGAPQATEGYPRFATFHDVRDERLSSVLRRAIVPWLQDEAL